MGETEEGKTQARQQRMPWQFCTPVGCQEQVAIGSCYAVKLLQPGECERFWQVCEHRYRIYDVK